MPSVDERIAACCTGKPAAEALRVQVGNEMQRNERLSEGLRKIGVSNAIAAVDASPQPTEQAVRN